MSHYRHTQVGWVILAVVALLGLFVLPRLRADHLPVTPLLVVLGLVLLISSSLTVEVDQEAIRLRFGIGLVRKRIPLEGVRGWSEVRNPWYAGWGIRLLPGGVLWNVSGLDAVELDVGSERRFRIGTDDPAALAAAIARVKGVPPVPGSPAEAFAVWPEGGVAWKAGLLVLVAGAILVGGIFWSQIRPPKVVVRPQGLEIDTLFYGTSCAAADITAISLESRLPRVLRKTNGFGGAGTLRGRFEVEGLGEGRLYVDEGFAPFVLVRLRQGFVIVSFRESQRTRALYEEMAKAWPDRASGP